jgi:hypothetical protein
MLKLKNYAAGAALALTAVALGGCYYAPAPGYGYGYAAPAYGYAPEYYAAPAYGYAPGVSLSFGERWHGRGRW